MSEDASDKQFAATPKRRADAAKKGDVFRSRDAATAAAMVAGVAWLAIAGPSVLHWLEELVTQSFSFRHRDLDRMAPLAQYGTLLKLFGSVLILAISVSVATLLSQLAARDGRFVGANLAFKGSRINPANGFKRMFGAQGWIEMGKGVFKTVLLGSVAAAWCILTFPDLLSLGRQNFLGQGVAAWRMLIELSAILLGGLIVLACLDLVLQHMQREKRLRMSHRETRDEHKESEGSPEMRAARRQRQRDIATGSVANAMREAQFVVTNPTHFSIALAYDPEKAAAPFILAKGRGDKALAIRELAGENRLPILDYPPLARSLYYTTRENEAVREELFGALAAIVAYVLAIRRGQPMPRPLIEVPIALRFDTEGRAAP